VSRARHSARHRPPRIPSATGSLSLGALSNSKFVRIGAAGVAVAGIGAGGAFALANVEDEPNMAPTQAASDAANMLMRQNSGTSRDLTTRPPVRPTSRPTSRKPPPAPKTKAAAPKPAVTVTPKAVGTRYATVVLNVRSGAGKHFPVVDQLSAGDKVSITGRTSGDWAQILVDSKPAWVAAEFLSTKKPTVDAASASGGISQAPCASGSAVEEGVQPDTIRVHRAVCALFPGVKSYGGLRGGGGYHAEGRALDIMIGTNSALGQEIANWVRAHAKELGVSEVIWAQHIWTVQRSSEGWRLMPDRGSTTANHYDHVHVSTYGNAGTV
jgi:hypothetical protein